jgi:hypothetical protein
LSNEGGWFDADKVRFRSGYPEKIGGWAALSYTTFLGVCRSLWSWVTNNSYSLIGVGTNLKFYVENGGAYYDITPIREINGNTGSAGPPVVNASVITLTAAGTVLTVSDSGAQGLQVNDFVTIAGANTIGVVDVNGEYQIQTVTSGTTYTVTLATSASGTASNANITIAYQIQTGSAIFSENTGWGSAPWGGYIVGGTSTTLNGLLTAAATTSMTVTSTTGFSATNSSILVGNASDQMVETSLPDDINDSVTTIFVLSTGYYGSGTPSTRSRFSTAGSILIDTEIITYTGLSNDGLSFTGCTRGAFSTTAANHDKGAVVYQNKLENIAYATNTGNTFDTLTRGNESTAGNNAQIYTVNPSNDTFTFTSPLVNGTPVRVATTGTTPGISPSGTLSVTAIYYVVNSGAPTTATCKLAATSGGTAIDITSAGVGTQTIITLGTTFATAANVYDAVSFPGWGEGFTSTLGLQLRLWSQTNFGEYLLYAERGGPPFVWDPGTAGTPAFTERGSLISAEVGAAEVPSNVFQIMVSSSSRITLAFGATDYTAPVGTGKFDPMLIRWTNVESFIDWDPLTVVGSQAGSLRLSHGSEIIGAMQTRQEILVWTDSALFSLQYIGYPFIWKNELLADNISIMGPNAMSTASGVSFWMGTDKFYVYSGRVETLPCSLRQYVFDDINTEQASQIFSGSNEGYSEVWWFYCSITGPDGTGTADNPNTTIDRYIIFNYLDRVWYYGTLNRTAWIDSGLRPYPLAAAGGTNLLVYHEAAVDNGETNPPTAITSYIQSSDFDIGDGHNYGFVWRVIPDITFNGSQTSINQNPTVDFVVRPRYNPGAAYGVASAPLVTSAQNYATQSTYNVQQFTQEVFTRIRGRQMAFRVECDSLGTQWQLGVPRIDIRPDGRR